MDSSSSTLYCNLADKNKLQKLCSRGRLLPRKPLPLLHDSCTAVFFTISETAVFSRIHLTLYTSGEYPVVLCFPEQTRVYFSMYTNHIQHCSLLCNLCFTFRGLRGCPSVLSFSSLNQEFQFVMGDEERIFLNLPYVHI